MSAFLGAQLDFILFFYGFAFVLLGLVCGGFARSMPTKGVWLALSFFGLAHGAAEWLDLLALVVGDGPVFAVVRVCVMTASFLILMEAARLGLKEAGFRVPGRWMYGPILSLVIVVGLENGISLGNATARYAIGLPGAMGVAFLFVLYARATSGTERRWTAAAAAGFALYAIAAGGIVPVNFLGGETVLSQDGFRFVTGIPIQLVRGTLACLITVSAWGIWGQRITRQVMSQRYTSYWNLQFSWTFGATITILICGWLLTQHLGGIYSHNVMDVGRGDLHLVTNLLSDETTSTANITEALADSPTLIALLATPNYSRARVNILLQRYVAAASADSGYILGRSGVAAASSDKRNAGWQEGDAVLFDAAAAGASGLALSFDNASRHALIVASTPILDDTGQLLGVAILKKSLAHFSTSISQLERPLFLVDADGLVMATNKPDMLLRALWPLSPERASRLTSQTTNFDFEPIQRQEINDGSWVTIGNEHQFAHRIEVAHSKWSLVMLIAPQGIGASRALGIVITLLTSAVSLVYLLGRERRVYDAVQSGKRSDLEQLAHDLDRQASTDTLTGTYNRLKFNQDLSSQIASARQSGSALSLVLYDIDHFKRVNDTHGHLAGDKTLVNIANLSRQKIRETDIHARWGGEEFVVLAPCSTISMACSLAEHLRCSIEEAVFETVGKLTCSFGVVQLDRFDTAETLLARADELLYKAKANGRNTVMSDHAALLPVVATNLVQLPGRSQPA